MAASDCNNSTPILRRHPDGYTASSTVFAIREPPNSLKVGVAASMWVAPRARLSRLQTKCRITVIILRGHLLESFPIATLSNRWRVLSLHNGVSPMAGMITGEDCRRKAAQWLDRAQTASDPKTSSSMRRACDAWTALAQQVERLSLRLPRSSASVGRPARLVKSRNNIDSFHVGDMLRERLRLSDEPAD
jgi:hypothetical protein